MTRRILMAALLAFACFAPSAAAQSCTLSITTLNFGNYSGTLQNGIAAGTVTCSGSWTIAFNAGTGSGATETVRKMTGPGGATLNYQLFTNSSRTVNWGNTTGNELTGTGNTSITVYGQISAGQYVAQGTYTDTITSATTSFTVTVVIPATCTISACASSRPPSSATRTRRVRGQCRSQCRAVNWRHSHKSQNDGAFFGIAGLQAFQ